MISLIPGGSTVPVLVIATVGIQCLFQEIAIVCTDVSRPSGGLFQTCQETSGAHPMCFTWSSHIAASMLMDIKLYPINQCPIFFISLVTSCDGLLEDEPQTAHPVSFIWASHIAACMLTGC